MLGLKNKALVIVFRWQIAVTVVVAALAAAISGTHGAISATLGGLIVLVAGVASGVLVERRKGKTAGEMLFAAIVAEGIRIGLILIGLGLVFAIYKDVVPGSLIAAFITTVLIFSMAFFVRENKE